MQTQLDKIEAKIDSLHTKLDDHKLSIVQRVTKLETGATVLWMVFSLAVTGLAGFIKYLIK